MLKACRTSYTLAFTLKVIPEAEAVENNSKIARDYGISESMVRCWRCDQGVLFNGERKMSARAEQSQNNAVKTKFTFSLLDLYFPQ